MKKYCNSLSALEEAKEGKCTAWDSTIPSNTTMYGLVKD